LNFVIAKIAKIRKKCMFLAKFTIVYDNVAKFSFYIVAVNHFFFCL